jgi:anti-sigma regulatory factor (Ser/Thr protein kinase)
MLTPRIQRPFEVFSNANSIALSGHFDISKIQFVTRTLRSLIEERGYQDIKLDFTDCLFTHAPPMLALITSCDHYRSQGVDFELMLPRTETLSRLFVNSNWAHIIQPERYQQSDFQSSVHMSAVRYATPDEQYRLVNDSLNKFLASATDFERSHLKALEWSINEITDNVLVHSHSPNGGLVQLTAMKKKTVEFVVCDRGIGIPKSFKSSGIDFGSDVHALSKAIEQGVTRDKSVGQGNGLYGSYKIAVKSGAHFSVHSGNATLYYTPKSGMHTKRESIPMIGTMVVCAIDYTSSLLLEEALDIKGAKFSPIDLIESQYETGDDGNIMFILKDHADSLGSRNAGTPVRNTLKNLIRFLDGNRVIVDFAGIHLISSSFADEVFGKLFLDLGPLDFSTRLEFKNMDQTVKLLIDKAILQRMNSK